METEEHPPTYTEPGFSPTTDFDCIRAKEYCRTLKMLDEMRRGVHPKSPNPYYIRFNEDGNLRGTGRVGVRRGCSEDTKNEEIGTDQEDIERNQREKIATKSDDAQVPEYLWAEHLITDFHGRTRMDRYVCGAKTKWRTYPVLCGHSRR